MKCFKILFLLTFVWLNTSYGQADSNSIAGIRKYVLWVDSLANPDYALTLNQKDSSRNIKTAIHQGSAYVKNRNLRGEYIAYTTSDDKSQLVYKIEMKDDLRDLSIKKYYFRNNQLIFASQELQDDGKKKDILFLAHEYYLEDSLSHKDVRVDIVRKKDKWRTNMNLKQTGEFYLVSQLNEMARLRSNVVRWSYNGNPRPAGSGNSVNLSGLMSPKYKYRSFNQGKVYFRNGDSSVYLLNLNYLDETMDYINADGKIMTLANPETIKYIIIGKNIFCYEKGYLEIIKQNNVARLAMRKTFEPYRPSVPGPLNPSGPYGIGPSGFRAGTVVTRIVLPSQSFIYNPAGNSMLKADTAYFISDTRTPFVKATKKNVAQMFAEKNKMVGKYFAKKNINMGKMQDLKDLVNYLSEMNNR